MRFSVPVEANRDQALLPRLPSMVRSRDLRKCRGTKRGRECHQMSPAAFLRRAGFAKPDQLLEFRVVV
jgi:hypothetical protein